MGLEGMTIGFIGLGLMGKPMARNLKHAGARVIVHNRSQGPMDELGMEGMEVSSSPAETTACAKIVITMLTDTPAVEAVIAGRNGIVDAVSSETLIIDMGTTKMPVTKDLASSIRSRGGAYLDAPVSGGTVGAIKGTLSIMVGGDAEALVRAMPIFDVLGSSVTHVGSIGAGQVAKAANQVIVGLTIGAVAEAFTLAKEAGVNLSKLRDALSGGFADSNILQLHGTRMIENNFSPGARSTVQKKDMDQALELAEEFRIEMPATSLNRDLYARLVTSGYGDLDHAALIKVFEPRD